MIRTFCLLCVCIGTKFVIFIKEQSPIVTVYAATPRHFKLFPDPVSHFVIRPLTLSYYDKNSRYVVHISEFLSRQCDRTSTKIITTGIYIQAQKIRDAYSKHIIDSQTTKPFLLQKYLELAYNKVYYSYHHTIII